MAAGISDNEAFFCRNDRIILRQSENHGSRIMTPRFSTAVCCVVYSTLPQVSHLSMPLRTDCFTPTSTRSCITLHSISHRIACLWNACLLHLARQAPLPFGGFFFFRHLPICDAHDPTTLIARPDLLACWPTWQILQIS